MLFRSDVTITKDQYTAAMEGGYYDGGCYGDGRSEGQGGFYAKLYNSQFEGVQT